MESKSDVVKDQVNVLHLIDKFNNGGAEKVMLGTVNGLPQYRHHIICLSSFSNSTCELNENVSVTVYDLNLDRNWDDLLWYYLRRFLKLKINIPLVNRFRFKNSIRKRLQTYIETHDINIVHTHHFWSQFLSRYLSVPGLRIFNTIHSQVSKADGIVQKLERQSYNDAINIIAVSHTVLKDYEQVICRKLVRSTVVYNYVEDYFWQHTKEHYAVGDRPLKLLCVGRLSPEKNHFGLLKALAAYDGKYLLDIYGAGPLKEMLCQYIEDNGLNVKLCDPIPNMEIARTMVEYDLFLLPSLTEGNPLSLLEAMACKLPAIVADIPVLREAGADTVLYFDLNDSASLHSILHQVSQDVYDLESQARRAFTKVRNQSSKSVYLDRIEASYNGS